MSVDHACGTAAARASVCAYMDISRDRLPAYVSCVRVCVRAEREKIESMNGERVYLPRDNEAYFSGNVGKVLSAFA